jgi:hypothetical protein
MISHDISIRLAQMRQRVLRGQERRSHTTAKMLIEFVERNPVGLGADE